MHPVIVNLGPLTIHSYGLFISLGFTFGILLAIMRAPRFKIEATAVLDMAIYAIISAIAGSRIFYVIVNYHEYAGDPLKIFYLHKGGLVFYGGLIGVVAALSYYIIKNKLDYFKTADMLITSLPLGHFFGRIGCFLNGCCYGAPTAAVTGVNFPNLKEACFRHPTQLYEAAFCLTSLFLLLAFEKFFKKTDGILFVLYIYMYSAWRFAIEFLRDDDRGQFLFGLSPSQNVSIAGFVFATIVLIAVLKTKKATGDKKQIK
ncbi:MAG TPA: prolipoprotein diacylglyceryl transferase [Candidatus Wallbacteria bacterium]|nr:prolipoprotein diacylglyceryl transferase [Candidatus Wallbacteria bacterium]